ncbi:MAG: radical SAM protein [Prevotella sp.]|nr:radical SAM protein [Prevotella sp.]
MYGIEDYLYNGMLFMNNIMRPRHKMLSQLMIYATTQCQSRCKHCSIWKKAEEHLSLEDVKAIVRSKCVAKNTTVGLEGGEFLLHPEADAIMEWLRVNHPCYTLLSNCLAPQKVIRAVRTYHPKHLYVSLDGNKETYQWMRGCNGYDKVIEVVEALKDEVPVSLMFCLSPWNSFKDMEYVINVAKHYSIDIRIGIYGTMDFFDTTADLMAVDMENYMSQIPVNIHDTDENFDFVALYKEWRNGHLRLRCHSIFSELVVHSNGNVPLCQNLDVVLGNVHEHSLDEIFNARQSVKLQCKYSNQCNKCWINFHRKYDIILLRNLEEILPKRVIEFFYGKYQWSDNKKESYIQYFRR